MRVAFVDQCGSKPGGAEESLALLLSHLPADIDPFVVLYESGEFEQRLREHGLPVTVVPIGDELMAVRREKPLAAITALPQAVGALARVLARNRIDLVHTNSMKAHLLASPAARLVGIRSVMHLRDMVEGLGRAALRGVSGICARERIAISEAVKAWYHLGATTVLANPVALNAYETLPERREARRSLNIPDDDLPLIGIVGRINRWKGQDVFLRVASSVNARRPIRCAIVGEARFRDEDFVPELEAAAVQLGIDAQTHFVPWTSDLRRVYAALDVNCNCSEREPFGRTIVEAAAAGVPTVAFDDGGAVDIIRDGVDGRIVPAGNERAFADAVFALAASEPLRTAYGAAAREASTRFEPATHAANVAEVLRRCAT